MLMVSYNNIAMTRGDTVVIDLAINDYELQETDTVALTVKRSVNDEQSLLQKTLDKENMQFVIDPDDTKDLPYGNYKYDIQITTTEGNVYTIVSPHNFCLQGEVTW